MKNLNEFLKTRPVHHKIMIMNVNTGEHKMLTEEEVRYIQTGIARGVIKYNEYCLVDKSGLTHDFAIDGRLTSPIEANTLRYNDDLAMSLLWIKAETKK